MISIIYSTHKDENYNNKFKQHLLQSVGLKNVQILEYQNNNEYSLPQIYNKGIKESQYDIIVCCHNDIKLEKGWGKKLLDDFEKNPDYGIIGKAGSSYFPSSGVYWEEMHKTMVGHVYHHPEGKNKWINKYSVKTQDLTPVVTLDGLFLSFNKTKIKHYFDESIGRFHFYDHPFCVSNYIDGIKLGVTFSFDITHQSVGVPNEEFFKSKDKFLEKFNHVLPLDLKPSTPYVSIINEKQIKNIGKVAVIILTKGNVEMLKNCVDSYYQFCNKELFDIFIADTGSTNEEKEWIKNNILNLDNVKLIEYDYYNFSKINNDVVINHLTDEHEFILFSNNDIKLLNNVIYGMLKTFKSKPNVGTIGCRLHFEDNTVQHDGILMKINNSNLILTHKNFKTYYNHSSSLNQVVGSTAALLMIRKIVFKKVGMFNEGYTNCLEDVELNLQCLIHNYINYCDSSLVAYHYESKTRKEEDKMNMFDDYQNKLIPFINKNINKLKKYIL